MSIVINNRTFTDEFTGAGGGGVDYLNGNVLGKMTVEIDFYSYLAVTGMSLQFTATENTITNANDLDFTDFISQGWKVGMIIGVDGTNFNDGAKTITAVTARVITVAEALVTELDMGSGESGCSLFDDTPITALDYYYNLVENSSIYSPASQDLIQQLQTAAALSIVNPNKNINSYDEYLSLTDKGAIQRFTVDGLDYTSATPKNMFVASISSGWVTNTLTNPDTGETSEVTIVGLGTDGLGGASVTHQQWFRITQTFHIAPFALREQVSNFQKNIAPDYFQDTKALKHICRIDGKFSSTDPNIPHSGSLTDINGLTNWFDQNNIRKRPDYYVDSITYTDDATSLALDRLDLDKIVSVLITLKSRAAQFDNGATKIILDFLYLPLAEGDYINTPDTTLRQNLMNDRKLLTEGTGGSGEWNGTDYQVLTQIVPTWINETTMEIAFKVNLSTFLKNRLKAKSDTDRNYAIAITTQDSGITSTIQTDRVPILCDVNNFDWDKTDDTLLEAVDNIRVYHFPHIGTRPKTSVSGWEGDPVYVEFPFRVKEDYADIKPLMKSAGFQIVVTKSGEEDFVLEEKIFETSLIRKLDGIQTIDISEEKNYIGMPDEYNTASLKRDISFDESDSGSDGITMRGFLIHYAFVLRYDFWNTIIQNSERIQFALFKDIETPTEAWNTLQQNGWELQIRFVAQIKGEYDFVTTFDQYWDIDCKYISEAPDAEPGQPPIIFESEVEYLDIETSMLTNGITKGKKTLITRTFTGNFTSMPENFNSLYGYIFADLENIGGVTSRRFASTEFDSEDDSPFSAPASDGEVPDHSWASKNVRIDVFNFSKAIVKTIYDDSKNEWSKRAKRILFYPKLGFMKGCFIMWEESGSDEPDQYMLSETGQRLMYETCES